MSWNPTFKKWLKANKKAPADCDCGQEARGDNQHRKSCAWSKAIDAMYKEFLGVER